MSIDQYLRLPYRNSTCTIHVMEVTVTIPATTANLGPGFDCLGLALDLHNKITFSTIAHGLQITIQGEGADQLPTDKQNLVVQAAERVFLRVGRRPAGLHIVQHNYIPIGSGLGSSAAAVLGGLISANALVEGGLTSPQLLQMAIEMEGHPDNVAAALHGGLVVVNQNDSQWRVNRLAAPSLSVVYILPQFSLSTAVARAALPKTVPMADAVFNLGRLAALVSALANADYDTLAWATQDRLHEPYRLPLIPGASGAVDAGKSAGASAVLISGAGPGLLAFAPHSHDQIAQAMQKAFGTVNIDSRYWILSIEQRGAVMR